MGSILNDLIAEENDQDNGIEDDNNDSTDSDAKTDPKFSSAVDFSDINELADEEEVKDEKTETNYDADDEGKPKDQELMPPPPPKTEESKTAEEKKKLETPLAAMLPSKYANVNVTELFPDFRPGQV